LFFELFALFSHIFCFQIPTDNIRICRECNDQILQFDDLINKAKYLDRLFDGLSEENVAELTLLRLNTYREHFKLKEKIEFIEYKVEEVEQEIEYETIERIEESYEEEEIIQEDYGVAEEIYLEPVEEDESLESEEVMFPQDPQQYFTSHTRKKPRKSDSLEKNEDEKLFTFQCHICSEPEFINMKLLTIHCKSEHNCLPLVKCCSEECDASLSTWRRLLIHKDKHFPDNEKLRCGECNR
jgi:hypothetical protein